MTIYIAIFSLLFLILAIKRLDLAVLLLIAGLPTYLIRFQIGPLPSTLLEVMIIIAFLVWFFKDGLTNLRWQNIKSHNWRHINYPFRGEIILILLIAYLSLLPAAFSSSALGIFKAYFLEAIMVFILAINTFKNKNDYYKIYYALGVSAFLVSVWAIVQKISGQFIANPFWANPEHFRAVSFYGYPNAVGLYLGPIIILLTSLLWLVIKKKETADKYRLAKIIFLSVTIIISLLAIVLARSEGALAAIAITAFTLFLLYGKVARYLALGLAVITALIIFSVPNIRQYVIQKTTFENISGRIRELQWQETYHMLRDGRIIMGAGLNQYPLAVREYHQDGFFFNRDNISDFDNKLRASAELRTKYWQPIEIYQYPHNIFLNFWSEIGLLGALLFSLLILRYLLTSFHLFVKYKKEKNIESMTMTLGLSGAMLVTALHGLVDVPYFKNDLSVLFWILVAILGIIIIQKHENNSPETNRAN